MRRILFSMKYFLARVDGAVTVDWVVLAAAVTGLGLAAVSSVRDGTGSLATSISDTLSGATVAQLGTFGTDGQPVPTEIILVIDPPVLIAPPPPVLLAPPPV